MNKLIFTFISIQSCILFASANLKSTSCFFPNGDPDSGGVPCYNSTGDGHSHCCHTTDICLDNGLCYIQSYSGDVARVSCTDESWEANSCPPYCRSTYVNTGCGLVGRLTIGGLPFWCCEFLNATGGCSTEDGPFQINVGKVIPNWGPLAAAAAIVSNAAPTTVTVTASNSKPTTSSTDSNDTESLSCNPNAHDAAIGAGVGVPLFCALLGALFLLWRERKKRTKAPVAGAFSSPVNPGEPKDGGVRQPWELDASAGRSELGSQGTKRELP